MRLDDAPFQTLLGLSERQASGELICATEDVELHVYLQRGRVAWATDSEHPFAFTRYLQSSAGIDADGFRDVLESCKRERRPLGETLMAWGLVTREEIRAALRHQLGLALALLREVGPAQTLFLDRRKQFESFDESLTFAMSELLPEPAAPKPATRRLSSAHHAAALTAATATARRLVNGNAGVVWSELFDGSRLVEAAPDPGSGPRVTEEVLARTVLDGADLAVLRLADALLAGVALTSARSLWCRFGADETVGAAVSILGMLSPAAQATGVEAARPSPPGPAWSHGDDGAAMTTELRVFVDRAPEILCALVREGHESGDVAAAGRTALPLPSALDVVRRREPLLATREVLGDATAAAVGFQFRSVMTAETQCWCFGAELGGPRRRTLWILTERRSSQGLGWAYLSSLGRILVQTGGGSRG